MRSSLQAEINVYLIAFVSSFTFFIIVTQFFITPKHADYTSLFAERKLINKDL